MAAWENDNSLMIKVWSLIHYNAIAFPNDTLLKVKFKLSGFSVSAADCCFVEFLSPI